MSGEHKEADSSLTRRAFLAASAVGAAGMALSASGALAASQSQSAPARGLEGKTVAILVAHEFEDVELYYPVVRFHEAGAKVIVATLPKDAGQFGTRPYWPEKPITGRFGATVPFFVLAPGVIHTEMEIPQLVEEVERKKTSVDALVFPGGFSPDFLRINAETLQFTADMYNAGKVVAAICHGPWILLSVDAHHGTNIVRDREVTGYVAIMDDIKNAGGIWRADDYGAVRVGNVVTGRVPDDLGTFCLAVIDAIQGKAGPEYYP